MGWDEPDLVNVNSDPPLRRRYRRLQSWYREEVLGLEPGIDPYGKARGNWLPKEAAAQDPSLNFLRSDELATIAEDRIADTTGAVGTDRLRRNLLSSQPLAVNLFGPLFGANQQAAAAVLQQTLHVDMSTISNVRIEWAPEPAVDYLDDRTAFDVYFEYAREDGCKGFVGIETKYTDSFSPDDKIRKSEEKRAKYTGHALALGVFHPELIDGLFHPKSSQLFRMALLASRWRIAGGFDFGICLVAALAEDKDAAEAYERVAAAHVNPHYLLSLRSHDVLVDAFEQLPGMERWASDFRQRYLDTTPVN